MMLIHSSQLFSVDANGMVTPKKPIRIGGVQMGTGVSFGSGVSVGDLRLTDIIGKMLDVDEEQGVSVIKRIV